MDLLNYFDPLPESLLDFNKNPQSLASKTQIYFGKDDVMDFELANVAILSVNLKDRYSNDSFEIIREFLYDLTTLKNIRIIDLGHLKRGNSKNDTLYALRDVVTDLNNLTITPIIISDSESEAYASYLSLEKKQDFINYASVNSRINLFDDLKGVDNVRWVIDEKSTSLFSYSNIGYQSYFVPDKTIQEINKKAFEAVRLGMARKHIADIEPIIRDADFISLNLNAIRQSDSPGQLNGSPNGFYNEEFCQISRYAGISNRLSSLYIAGFYPDFDKNNQTAHLISQSIWYFLEGKTQLQNEHPALKSKSIKKFNVPISSEKETLVFYRSETTDRWWMEVPHIAKGKKMIVSCNYEDYRLACDAEIPDRWIKKYQKLN